MLEELNGKYQALLQEKRALEVRLSRAEKAPERNREPGETSANPDVNPTAERQRTSRETRNPTNPEPSAGDSRLTTVLERLLESRESPKVEKYYELPKVMDKPANLGELRAWIEALRTYVPNVKTVGTMGLEKFLEGRMKGHIKRITEKQVAKLKAAGTFQENLDSYVRIWCKQFGLDDDDDWARKKLKELSFNGGSPAEFMVKIEAIFDEMVKDPLSARDKVQTFFICVKIPSLVQLWKYNSTTGRPWTVTLNGMSSMILSWRGMALPQWTRRDRRDLVSTDTLRRRELRKLLVDPVDPTPTPLLPTLRVSRTRSSRMEREELSLAERIRRSHRPRAMATISSTMPKPLRCWREGKVLRMRRCRVMVVLLTAR